MDWCKRGGSRGYVVTATLTWDVGKRSSGWVLHIPVGREFESSVPRWLQWVLSPDHPAFLRAAAIHDSLLEAGFRQRFCDGEWLQAARADRAPAIRREIAFVGMRLRRFLRNGKGHINA